MPLQYKNGGHYQEVSLVKYPTFNDGQEPASIMHVCLRSLALLKRAIQNPLFLFSKTPLHALIA